MSNAIVKLCSGKKALATRCVGAHALLQMCGSSCPCIAWGDLGITRVGNIVHLPAMTVTVDHGTYNLIKNTFTIIDTRTFTIPACDLVQESVTCCGISGDWTYWGIYGQDGGTNRRQSPMPALTNWWYTGTPDIAVPWAMPLLGGDNPNQSRKEWNGSAYITHTYSPDHWFTDNSPDYESYFYCADLEEKYFKYVSGSSWSYPTGIYVMPTYGYIPTAWADLPVVTSGSQVTVRVMPACVPEMYFEPHLTIGMDDWSSLGMVKTIAIYGGQTDYATSAFGLSVPVDPNYLAPGGLSPSQGAIFLGRIPVTNYGDTITAGTYVSWHYGQQYLSYGAISPNYYMGDGAIPNIYVGGIATIYITKTTIELDDDLTFEIASEGTCSAFNTACDDTTTTCWYRYVATCDLTVEPNVWVVGSTPVETKCTTRIDRSILPVNEWRFLGLTGAHVLSTTIWVGGIDDCGGGCPAPPAPPTPPSPNATLPFDFCFYNFEATCALDSTTPTVTMVAKQCLDWATLQFFFYNGVYAPDGWDGPYLQCDGYKWYTYRAKQDCSDGCPDITLPDPPTVPPLPDDLVFSIPAGSWTACCPFPSWMVPPPGAPHGNITVTWAAQDVAMSGSGPWSGTMNIHIAWTGHGDPTCPSGISGYGVDSMDTTVPVNLAVDGSDSQWHIKAIPYTGFGLTCAAPTYIDVAKCGAVIGVYSDALTLMSLP